MLGSTRWATWTILFICFFAGATQVGADCVDYRDFIQMVGSSSIPTGGWDIEMISDSYAYVSSTTVGQTVGSLAIMNISDPQHPSILKTISSGRYYGIAISGLRLYAVYETSNSSGVQVYDISNPLFPVSLGSWSASGRYYDVAVAGTYAYVADNLGYLQVIDFTNPQSPSSLANLPIPGAPYAVEVSGSFAYVTTTSSLQIVDVSNPAAPAIVGSTTTPMAAYGLALMGSYALVADLSFGLRVIDISNPASPSVIASVDIPHDPQRGGPYGVCVSGGYAFLAGNFSGLTAVDISDPFSPFIVGSAYSIGQNVVAFGSHAYVIGQGFSVIDIRNPALPPIHELLMTGNNLNNDAIALSGTRAFMAVQDGIQIADISTPEAPSILGSLSLPGGVISIAVSGTHAYIGDTYGYPGPNRFQVVDVSNPASPAVVGMTASTRPGEIAISGDYAYVACDAGLQVIKIKSSANPQTITTVSIPEFPCTWLSISGNYAFVTGEKYTAPKSSGLRVVDISNPTSPAIVGGITSGSEVWRDIQVVGNYAYVAGSPGLHIVDVSIPASPSVVATMAIPPTWLVAVSGSFAYLKINPSYISYIQAIDIRNPLSPSLNGNFNLRAGASSLAASSSQLYFGFGPYLSIYPLTCPSSTGVENVVPSVHRLYQNSPNPFRETTRVAFDLPVSSDVKLEVFDLAGRRVQELGNGTYPAGHHGVSWDARDAAGRSVVSGIYFLRLEAGSFAETKRMYLSR